MPDSNILLYSPNLIGSYLSTVSTPDSENFLDMVAGIQGSRMNDQRASLPQFPGLNSQAVINQYLRERNVNDVPDDSFFEMLMRCQVKM
ncbi:hypothetical protein DPMN_147091 [Dreissena polymorpha]|uniref:Uncharacterized protein n=1 Tax=Dreissena polymorpha TaxID=45954 RepID=A0A9D4FD22_DREPO|nr:hypothetical protein DPMN_147091 [Dreissena polymorpha]